MMMGLRKGKYCRKIGSFLARAVKAVLKYDASLTGLGILLFKVLQSGALSLVKVATIITPYRLNQNSKFQNSMEFTAVTTGFMMMAEMGWTDVPVKIIGDSKTSETWCAKERFRSTVARSIRISGFWR